MEWAALQVLGRWNRRHLRRPQNLKCHPEVPVFHRLADPPVPGWI